MPRPPGLPKTGGRQPGSVNKKQALHDRARELGLEPWDAMCILALDKDGEHYFAALKEVCDRLFPKLKAIEVTGKDGADLNPPQAPRTIEELAQIVVLAREAMRRPREIE
jgi:hypothetical protein